MRRPAGGLAMQAHFEDADLLAVTAPPETVYTAEMSGFFPGERRESLTWRWIGSDATWKVVNRSARVVVATADIEMWAFGEHPPAAATYSIGGRSTCWPSSNEAAATESARSPWRREVTSSAFHPLDPPTVADDLLHNGDRRALSVAFGSWHWTVTGERP